MPILLNIFFSFIYFSAHPFHVSVCDVYYNKEAKSIAITHKIFLDDLEQALRKSSGRNIDIMESASNDQLGPLVDNYLEKNFTLTVDGKRQKLNFIGSEIQADAIWIYQESAPLGSFEEVSVKNTVLFEMFDDQTNLVHIKNGKKTKSLRLYEENQKGEVEFN